MGKMLDTETFCRPAAGASSPDSMVAGDTAAAAYAQRLLAHSRQGPVVCIECDLAGRVTSWNSAATRLYGWTSEQALHRPLQELVIPPAEREAFARHWSTALAGSTFEDCVENCTQDLRSLHCYWSITPLLGGTGLAESVMCMAWDMSDMYRAMEDMAQSRKRLLTAQRLAKLGSITWDLVAGTAMLHDDACTLLGYPAGTVLTRSALLGTIEPEDRMQIERDLVRSKADREPELHFCCRCTTGDGRRISLRVIIEFEYEPDGTPRRSLSTIQDVTVSTAALQALAESEARLDDAQELAHVGDWEWDFALHKSKISKEALRILGRPMGWDPTEEEFVNSLPPGERERVVDLFKSAFAQALPIVRYEYKLPGENGTQRDVFTIAKIEYRADGKPARLKAVMQEVTELKSYQRQLHELSFFDSLTQLPNRALFVDRFKQALSDASWHGHRLGVMMLDLDRFKQVNDSLGHGMGDELLKHTAVRLQEALRDYDTVARLGGDEFAIILPEVRQATDLGVIAGKVVSAFDEPFSLAGQDVVVTASIGVALFPNDGQDVDELLQYADAALYHAKEKGRNNFQFYSKDLTAHASERLALESELRKAIERNELELFYQPKIDLATNATVGAEALMRWNNPQRGMVPPDKFIGIAEDTGLIVQMGAWALEAACQACVRWNTGRAEPLKIAVNLSPRQFAMPDFVDAVCSTLNKTGCKPEWIELEITESLLLDARSNIREMLETLAATGITIAIDDFGTGYSALSYLTRFPVQTLKIDRSFVRGLPGDHGSAALVKAVISLAQSLRMELVAEGVETGSQAIHLTALGCQMAQGFMYSKPLPVPQFEAWLADQAG